MLQTILDWLGKNSPVILLGIFGGLVRQINEKHTTTRIFVCGMMTSAFVAVLTHLLLINLQMPGNLKAVLIGISGYSAVQVLSIINEAVLKRIEKIAEIPQEKGKNNESDS